MSTTAAPQAPPDDLSNADLVRFEEALQARYPGRQIRRYEMPSNVFEARALYLLELTSKDELRAAEMADTLMTPIERKSIKMTAEAERRECMRLSIVGLVARNPLAYRQVNHDGVPFMALDNWSAKASSVLITYYNDLNGVPTSELLEGLKGARTLGAPTPPTPAIQP